MEEKQKNFNSKKQKGIYITKKKDFWEKCLKILQTFQAAATIIAIVVGGFWTYKLFIEGREEYPQANLTQKISHVALSDEINLVRVELGLSNIGNRLVNIKKGSIRIQQILPLIDCSRVNPCAANKINTALTKHERQEDRFRLPTCRSWTGKEIRTEPKRLCSGKLSKNYGTNDQRTA